MSAPGLEAIEAVTSIPSVPPTDASLDGKTVTIAGPYNAIQVFGIANTSGTITLLRWNPSLATWTTFGADAASGEVTFDTGKLEGQAHGRWLAGSYAPGVWAVLADGAVFDELYLGGISL